MAPQVGLEPTTLRLTAEGIGERSCYKHKAYSRETEFSPEFGGDLGVLGLRPMRRNGSEEAAFHSKLGKSSGAVLAESDWSFKKAVPR
jgi:hypothetical protein